MTAVDSVDAIVYGTVVSVVKTEVIAELEWDAVLDMVEA